MRPLKIKLLIVAVTVSAPFSGGTFIDKENYNDRLLKFDSNSADKVSWRKVLLELGPPDNAGQHSLGMY